MKIQLLSGRSFALSCIVFFSFSVFAQNAKVTRDVIKPFDEQVAADKMRKEGLSEAVIAKLIAQRKELIRKAGESHPENNTQLKINGTCSDIGVENGWSQWTGVFGTNISTNPPIWGTPSNPPPASTSTQNISITTGSGIDPCTPGTAPGAPAIPVVCPGFGNASIHLGKDQTPNAIAEQVTFPLMVTAQDTNFIYSYALVFYDPGSSHAPNQAPFAEFMILDANGDTVACSYHYFIHASGDPSYYTASANCLGSPSTVYKPWTTAGINLAPYIGQQLTVVITNGDCVQGGHFAHSYWDFSCGAIEPEYCTGQLATLCASSDPAIQCTYQWYKNGNIFPGGTTPCIVTSPHQGDTFSVVVLLPTGCNFYLTYIPKDSCLFQTSITSTSDTCSKNIGTATAIPQFGAPPYTYLWSNGQISQTATGLSAGSYTVTIIDVNNSTLTAIGIVGNTMSGGVISSVKPVSCFGGNNGSATVNSSGGIPPITYLWSNAQTTQNATGLIAGTYTVVITDATGCSATLTVLVPGSSLLVTNTSYTPASCLNCPDGSATMIASGGTPPYTYQWSDGQSTLTATGLLPGTYQVCVVDAHGCKVCDIIHLWWGAGVHELMDNNSFVVSPNPSSGNIFIDFGSNNFGEAEISVSNVLGETLILEKNIASGKVGFDVSWLSSGIYFLKLKTDQGDVTKKVVINR